MPPSGRANLKFCACERERDRDRDREKVCLCGCVRECACVRVRVCTHTSKYDVCVCVCVRQWQQTVTTKLPCKGTWPLKKAAYINKSKHTHEQAISRTIYLQSCCQRGEDLLQRMQVWTVTHIWMRHVSNVNASCHAENTCKNASKRWWLSTLTYRRSHRVPVLILWY